MTTKVIHTCDRCGKSGDPEHVNLRGIFLRVGTHLLHDYGGAQRSETFKAEWCDDCVRVCHIWPPRVDSPPPIDPAPTLEDLIRQIAREEQR